MVDFRIENLKGVTTLAEGRLDGILAEGVRENRSEIGTDWTFDVARFIPAQVHLGPDTGPVDLVVFTGLGGKRLRGLAPGPAVACIYGPFTLAPTLAIRSARVACLMDPARQRLDELLAMLPRAA